MEGGLRISWGKIIQGREKQAFDLFDYAMTYFEGLKKKGTITYYEPFFVRTADQDTETGFFVIKGPDITKVTESDEFLLLLSKSYYLLSHFKVDTLVVGEGVVAQLDRSAKARAELGI